MAKRKVFAFTGIRSEYDLQYSLARHLHAMPGVDFRFVVFGAHLSEEFGLTVRDIEADGFNILARIKTPSDDDSFFGKTRTAAILLEAAARIFSEDRPDIIVVTGDREEVIAASVAATYFNIPICHLFGGDKTFPDELGNVDEQIRHATTKLAHLHFPIHKEHSDRIMRMGEEPWRVNNFGSPALDKYNLFEFPAIDELSVHFGISLKKKEYAVLIHHPLPNNVPETKLEVESMLEVLAGENILTFLSYPNSDPGNKVVIDTINDYAARNDNFVVYKNLPRKYFVPMISNSAFLIGNSSMGLLECPYLMIPAINVGPRQKQRINAGNVLFVDNDKKLIEAAIDKATKDHQFIQSLESIRYCFGNGQSGKRIAETIASIDLDAKLLAKRITY